MIPLETPRADNLKVANTRVPVANIIAMEDVTTSATKIKTRLDARIIDNGFIVFIVTVC